MRWHPGGPVHCTTTTTRAPVQLMGSWLESVTRDRCCQSSSRTCKPTRNKKRSNQVSDQFPNCHLISSHFAIMATEYFGSFRVHSARCVSLAPWQMNLVRIQMCNSGFRVMSGRLFRVFRSVLLSTGSKNVVKSFLVRYTACFSTQSIIPRLATLDRPTFLPLYRSQTFSHLRPVLGHTFTK